MRDRRLVIAIGAAGVLGLGLWLGRASSSSSSSPPAPSSTADPTPGSPEVAVTERAARRAHVAAPALPARRPAAVTPGLAEDLAASDPRIRRAAVREAADGDLDPALLLAASRDPDLEVAVVATAALGRRYAAGELPAKELIARATDRGAPERVRSAALNGLGLVATPEAAATLTALVARGDVLERRTAAALLVHQDPAIAVPALIGALADADEYVRAQALDALRARARGRDFGTDQAAWRAWWDARRR